MCCGKKNKKRRTVGLKSGRYKKTPKVEAEKKKDEQHPTDKQ